MVPTALRCISLLVFALASALSAQGLLMDINAARPEDWGSNPRGFATVGTQIYFAASDDVNGDELWVTDGTPAGTRLVQDISPGRGDSSPYGMVELGGYVYFAATDSVGADLWRTDGTPAGTALVKDVRPGALHSNMKSLTVAAGKLFFSATDGTRGTELWISDGTTAGTVLVDLVPGSGSSIPDTMVEFGGRLFFTAISAGVRRLWSSDGTVAGTSVFSTSFHFTVPTYGKPNLAKLGHLLLFSADSGSPELWRTDGTVAGTVMVAQFSPLGTPVHVTSANGRVWFGAASAVGAGLWSSDGTPAGTVLVAPVNEPMWFQAFGTNVLFSARTGNDRHAWITDGTSAGTVSLGKRVQDDNPRPFALVGSVAVFSGGDGSSGAELYATDGTLAGTALLKEIYPGYGAGSDFRTGHASLGGWLYFQGIEPIMPPGRGGELWRTDGTTLGTTLFANILPSQSGNSDPAGFVELLGRSVFSATDGLHGTELWISDGTTAGTALLKDIQPGGGSSDPTEITRVGDRVFFSADDGVGGRELWMTDGTTAGTSRVADIQPGPIGSWPQSFVDLGGRLLFSATDGVGDRELWTSDGTGAGTTRVADIWPGGGSSAPEGLTRMGNRVYFAAEDPVHGRELWASDGTTSGTVLVTNIHPTSSSSPVGFVAIEGRLWFRARTASLGEEPFVSDGTSAGTRMVADIRPGTGDSVALIFTGITGGLVMFVASNPASGTELYASDGTAAGTVLIDIVPGSGSSFPEGLVAIRGLCCFSATTVTHGRELWVSDGTVAGTRLLVDVLPGRNSGVMSGPGALSRQVRIGNRMLFPGNDGTTGYEPWITDGTVAGTRLAADLLPGIGSSMREYLVPYRWSSGVVGTRAVFPAVDATSGNEPFVVDLAILGSGLAEPFGVGCPGSNGTPRFTGDIPVIGATLSLTVGSARPNAAFAALLGIGPAPTPIGGGCTMYLMLSPMLALSGVSDSSGTGVVPVPIPKDNGLVGGMLHAQVAVLDPAGAWHNALAFTNPMKIVVGR
ncbi:MAG: hypothetical protein IT458_15340 [Planctomycetes bacterium]|nr:hypothetical protein [Planctomycetota bacterium]